ncbi:hypothetical protein L1D44_19215 [Shewanella sp. Isolate13]|uniref:hypothetical protein n=1 Tax=Shewanella sp. Isolate13 TaxID=2908531 RepID=UPI001EFEB10A|nr:hypothetical protein [Shewanella sp. Isolate13]MCG9731922.1 hypothetical protein [Shewanella sp. Isolate13]
MKVVTPVVFFTSLLLSSFSYSATKITSKEAPFYEGKDVIACGTLKEVSRFKRGLYLNMDEPFPKQSLTLVLWEDDLAEFKQEHGSIEQLINHEVCGKGTVTEYRGRSQISLYNAFSLKVGH